LSPVDIKGHHLAYHNIGDTKSYLKYGRTIWLEIQRETNLEPKNAEKSGKIG